ncbi:uncharacterized protein [Solanum tuberosum]|uniref:uncharacterized protein n=1 Tax=Solanum tuberosum TaxID=4113 RepID=UPI00073A1915|nr:PREDICTED: uncharacterized protein LOC107061886 [Solanum tuberosum]
MGLNEIYTVIRGSILMMNPLPTMAQAFSLLVQDEHQREIKPSNHFNVEATALHAGNVRPSSSNVRPSSSYKTNYAPTGGHSQLQYKDKFCTYCNRTGHLIEKCYQLHGYPTNSNNPSPNQRNNPTPRPNTFRKGNQRTNKGSGNNVVANANCTPDFTPGKRLDEEMYNVSLTKDQYGHVQGMLQQFHREHENEGSNNNPNLANGPATDFAGIIVCTSSIDFGKLSCNCFKNKSDSWILDSGASNHMTFNMSLLHNITLLPYPLLVALPNGYKVKVTQVGSVTLGPMINLDKVLYVPSFKYNLISIHTLTVHSKYTVSFTKTSCFMQAPSMKRPLVIGSAEEGLYFLCPSCLKNSFNISKCSSVIPNNSCNNCSNRQSIQTLDNKQCTPILNKEMSCSIPCPVSCTSSSQTCAGNHVDIVWHNRLGHVPFVKMRDISTIPVKFSAKQPFMCSICPMARQERLPFKPRTTLTSHTFELLHVDLWGPYHTPTHNHFKYFYFIVAVTLFH